MQRLGWVFLILLNVYPCWARDPQPVHHKDGSITLPVWFNIRIPYISSKSGQETAFIARAEGSVTLPPKGQENSTEIQYEYHIVKPPQPPKELKQQKWKPQQTTTSIPSEQLKDVYELLQKPKSLWTYQWEGVSEQKFTGKFAGLSVDIMDEKEPFKTFNPVFLSRSISPHYDSVTQTERFSESTERMIVQKNTPFLPGPKTQRQGREEFVLHISDLSHEERLKKAEDLGVPMIRLLRPSEEIAVRKLAELSDGSFLVAQEADIRSASKDPLTEISVFKVDPDLLTMAEPVKEGSSIFDRITKRNLNERRLGPQKTQITVLRRSQKEGKDFEVEQKLELPVRDPDSNFFEVKKEMRVARISGTLLDHQKGHASVLEQLKNKAQHLAKAISPEPMDKKCPFDELNGD